MIKKIKNYIEYKALQITKNVVIREQSRIGLLSPKDKEEVQKTADYICNTLDAIWANKITLEKYYRMYVPYDYTRNDQEQKNVEKSFKCLESMLREESDKK